MSVTVAQVILALISPAIAVVITFWGFRRRDRHDQLMMLFDLQTHYLADHVRLGRRLIHTQIASADQEAVDSCTSEDLSTVGRALAVMNMIALFAENGQVDSQLFAESMGRSFSHAVLAAKPYIDYVEARRGFRPYPFAEQLARRLATSKIGG